VLFEILELGCFSMHPNQCFRVSDAFRNSPSSLMFAPVFGDSLDTVARMSQFESFGEQPRGWGSVTFQRRI